MIVGHSRLVRDLKTLGSQTGDVPGKRRVTYGTPVLMAGVRVWRTFSDTDTEHGALPYERVLGEVEYVEHVARSALEAGAGRNGPVGRAMGHLLDARRLVEYAFGWIEWTFRSRNPEDPA